MCFLTEKEIYTKTEHMKSPNIKQKSSHLTVLVLYACIISANSQCGPSEGMEPTDITFRLIMWNNTTPYYKALEKKNE